jgi:hypothetical protein
MQRTRGHHFDILTMTVGEVGVVSVRAGSEASRCKLDEVLLNQARDARQRVSLLHKIECEDNFRMKTLVNVSLIAIALAFLLPTVSQDLLAQGRHPHYLHALSDLRDARAHLERPNRGELRQQEKEAIHQIDEAIGEIKRASIDDGKNIEDHAAVDPHMPWQGRLHKSRDLIDKAIADCSKEEDDPHTRGLQARILDHLHKAHNRVDEAIAIVDHR